MKSDRTLAVVGVGLLAAILLTFGAWQAGFWQSEPGPTAVGEIHTLRDLLAQNNGRLADVDLPDDIGGTFSLTSHTGQEVNNRSFGDQYKLVYFGYTFCPDVCPTELSDIRTALDQVGDTANQIQPIFITLDPERDTPEHLAGYVPLFHDRLVGLTGTLEEIEEVASAFQVRYEKVEDPANVGYYHIDHTSLIYLIGPDDTVLDIYVYNDTADDIAAGLNAKIGSQIN
jgi:protein SCO1/2